MYYFDVWLVDRPAVFFEYVSVIVPVVNGKNV